nr:ABC transporter permease [Chthoniobacterales bacterium]
MKRFILAALFFGLMLLAWEWAYRAKLWSPVLLPAPGQVAVYLKEAAADGTLGHATVITM